MILLSSGTLNNLEQEELRHDILSHFFDGLTYVYGVGKPKTNGLPRKKNTKLKG